MTSRQKTAGIVASALLLVAAIAAVLLGHGLVSVLCFLAAGIGLGIFGPPTDSTGIHGASDST